MRAFPSSCLSGWTAFQAGDAPEEPGNRDDERVAVRHADASGGDIIENQHDEKLMRDIHIGRRGSETANEKQPHKWRKTERFQQEAPNASASSDPLVALAYPASGETQDRPGSVLVQKSGHVGDDEQISVLDAIHTTRWMDERVVASEKRWISIEEKMQETSREVN